MNTWLESRCCHCNAANLVDSGDQCDLTGYDVEGFACWKCETNNEFDDRGNAVASQEDQIDQGYPVPKSTVPVERPYITKKVVTEVRNYNPSYGDDRMCKCGHRYHRHFDFFEENGREDVGCKYCDCFDFVEASEE